MLKLLLFRPISAFEHLFKESNMKIKGRAPPETGEETTERKKIDPGANMAAKYFCLYCPCLFFDFLFNKRQNI
jgi:hypothetical protein